MSVYVGDRPVQRCRRAPSGENASKRIIPNRQQMFCKNVTAMWFRGHIRALKAAEYREKS
jgi:hypothetical protein